MKYQWNLVNTIIVVILIILFMFRYFPKKETGIDHNKYFDANGTTPMCKPAKKALISTINCGNASSHYYKGNHMENARRVILQKTYPGKKYKIIFNSGASEGNNFILRSLLQYDSHVVLSAMEHHTSIECVESMGIDYTLVMPNSEGEIDPIELIEAIKPNTKLVSIMHWNNETGTKNNLHELVNAVKIYCGKDRKIWFHSDVVQSFGKLTRVLPELDAFTMSYHKVYGPMGIGVLAISPEMAKHTSAQISGTQQYELRGGTENIPAIASGTRALENTWNNREQKNQHLASLKMELIKQLNKNCELDNFTNYHKKEEFWIPEGNPRNLKMIILGPTRKGIPDSRSAPNTLLMSFVKPGTRKHICNIKLREELEKQGFNISIGSACQTNKKASHVLSAIQAPFIVRAGVIRISFLDQHRKKDVKKLAEAIIKALEKQIN